MSIACRLVAEALSDFQPDQDVLLTRRSRNGLIVMVEGVGDVQDDSPFRGFARDKSLTLPSLAALQLPGHQSRAEASDRCGTVEVSQTLPNG